MTKTKPRYTVRAAWDPDDPAGSWTITVDDHPGAVSFVRRPDQIAATAADLLTVWTERRVDAADIDVAEITFPGRAGELAARARIARALLREVEADVQVATAEAVEALAAEDVPAVVIGPLVGISRQRVDQILAGPVLSHKAARGARRVRS